jgi:hypothetical protein
MTSAKGIKEQERLKAKNARRAERRATEKREYVPARSKEKRKVKVKK